MAELKSGIILQDGEELVAEIEAELWASSANPIAKALGNICGCHIAMASAMYSTLLTK